MKIFVKQWQWSLLNRHVMLFLRLIPSPRYCLTRSWADYGLLSTPCPCKSVKWFNPLLPDDRLIIPLPMFLFSATVIFWEEKLMKPKSRRVEIQNETSKKKPSEAFLRRCWRMLNLLHLWQCRRHAKIFHQRRCFKRSKREFNCSMPNSHKRGWWYGCVVEIDV